MPSNAPWAQQLQPASFRGAFFRWSKHDLEGGRRAAVFEFPLRDDPFVEDLGRRGRRYTLTGYVIGPDYFSDRDALIDALEAAGTGTLIHPYLGQLTVQVDTYRASEDQRAGGMAAFEMVFLEGGSQPSPVAMPDTASAVLGGSNDLLTAVAGEFEGAYQVANLQDFVPAAAEGLLTGFAAAFAPLLATPNADLSDVDLALGDLGGNTAAVALVATEIVSDVQGCMTGFADAVTEPNPDGSTTSGTFISASSGPVTIGAATAAVTENSSRNLPPGISFSRDVTFGLAAFMSYGATMPAVSPTTADRAIQAGNQAAFVQLVQVSAAAAVAQIYADTEFASAQDAEDALSSFIDQLDALALAAADQGQDALYASLERLSALVTADLTSRAAELPDIVTYVIPGVLPSLALAERLYQDASRANELVARNDVPHPAFMPRKGEALRAVTGPLVNDAAFATGSPGLAAFWDQPGQTWDGGGVWQ